MKETLTSEQGDSMKIETVRLLCCTDCGSTAKICEQFQEQADGDPENRVSDYCGKCGHSRDCHEALTSNELVSMARAAQRDERLSDGALYGRLADEIERLQRELKIQNDANEILTRDVAELKHDNARLYASLTAEVNADWTTADPDIVLTAQCAACSWW